MTDEPTSPAPGGKGRPTPKRAPSRGPVAPPPLTRREAAKRLREANAAKRGKVRRGLSAGEDGYLLPRDAGPVRRLVRDLVDSRRTTASFLLPAAVLPLLGSLTGNRRVEAILTTVWILALTLAIADFVAGTLRIRRTVRERFPEETRLGRHAFYGIVRMLQFRRLRVPKPAVAVGDPVR